jgi:alpha-L-rhamnosidase
VRESKPHFILNKEEKAMNIVKIFSSVFQKKYFSVTVLLFMGLLFQNITASDAVKLVNIRTEYKTNPVGIDVAKPRLSWEITFAGRSFIQAAYEIRAAESEKYLKSGKNLLWDSKKIESEKSNQIAYNGTPLTTGQRVYWQVKIWDKNGKSSEWSDVNFWEMGLLQPSDWKAKWILPDVKEDKNISNPAPYLRNEFDVKNGVKSARAYITSHGLYEFHINGNKVGDQLFTPGWTSYNKRLQYQTYDVTKYFQTGKNAIGVILGEGWYRGRLAWAKHRNIYGDELALLLQVKVEYNDGTTEDFVSDQSWKASQGPILMSGIYDGEIYDARLEMDGWDKTGYNDNKWNKTIEKDLSKSTLVAAEGPAVRITGKIKPVKKFTTPNGDVVFDMGQNMVGWVQIKLKGKQGEKITLHHAEVLDQKGNIYLENLRSAEQKVEYTFKGGDAEVFEPHFTFQGFRYVAVTGYKGEISAEDITGKVIHSDMTPAGNFSCSDSLINKLQQNIQWGLRGNFVDVPTDCPQRDERLGWTGDAEVFAPTACFNMDAASFYSKWMKDFTADQLKDGRVTHVVPNVLSDNDGGAAGWADAAVIVPWTVYQNYGDTRVLENQYESMKAWIKYMKGKAGSSYLWNKDVGFGDWLAFASTASDYPGATTDKDLIGTAYYYYSTSLVQKIAVILGKEKDAKEYLELMKNIKAAFQKEFVTQNGRVASNTQTAYVLALNFNLLQDDYKASAAKRLADDVAKFKHITTGFLGASSVCKVLTDYGYNDLAFMLLFNKKYPSWLYPVLKGATTIWERWDGITSDGGFQDAGMNSFNHYAYGAVGKWIYSFVAGIDTDPDKVGYKNIIMNPNTPKELTYAKADYHSIYGDIKSSWKNEGNSFILDVQVPANTTADVYLPSELKDKITEGNKQIDSVKEIQFVKAEGGKTIWHIGSGAYHFEVKK